MPVLSILIPAYNEAATIAAVLERLLSVELPTWEAIVIDDGSTDETAAITQQFVATHPDRFVLIRQPTNAGKTAAIAAGLARFSGQIVVIQDADLEYDPAEIPDVIAPILAGRADVVFGSRFLVKKAARVLYYYHYLANKSLTFLSNVLTNRNMSDIETCYKALRAEVARPLQLQSRGFGMEVEITAKVCQTRARTYEVPISYYGRTYEEGKKISTVDGLMAIWYILYFNTFGRWTAESRRYRDEVNAALRAMKP